MRIRYLKRIVISSLFTKLLVKTGLQSLIFTTIHRYNLWANPESVSGDGSSLLYTEHLRSELPKLISSLRIKTILDAPCGDFNWFNKMLNESKINLNYTGIDIVKPLITKNQSLYNVPGTIKFECANILRHKLDEYDAVLSRDFIFHLSFRDSQKFLLSFYESKSNYLITSSYPNVEKNTDIHSGQFREINLFQPPYCFEDNKNVKIMDYISSFPERYLYVFSREEVSVALANQQKLLSK